MKTRKTKLADIQIVEPILEKDFRMALKLADKNVVAKYLTLEALQELPMGELLVAKSEDKVVGMLSMRFPGRVFTEYGEEYFAIDKYKYDKKDVGFIILVATDEKYRRRGIAKKLLKKAIKLQKEAGAKAVGVFAWQGSPENSSEQFFAANGFKNLEMHHSPWLTMSKELGPEGYWCSVCGNPCKCDDLEMMLDFFVKKSSEL